jgi:glycerophosphoryl diester phosphodiesterase
LALQFDKVIGHRGACGYAPENTLSSMNKAFELGLKWVEFDVMLTKTGEPIIFHDFTLERTTNGFGKVAETELAAIRDLDCGSWFSEKSQAERIPTLKELLQPLQYSLLFFLEIDCWIFQQQA